MSTMSTYFGNVDLLYQHGDLDPIRIGENGFIRLVDCMPRMVPVGQTGDSAIVQAARVSYGAGTKKVNEDRGLIRYLLRNWHTTPFEMVEFKFHVKMPVFVARQWIRHRTANVNEYSARYSELSDEMFVPEEWRGQSKTNKQGSDGGFSERENVELGHYAQTAQTHGIEVYRRLLERGVSREQARIVMPVSHYTEWYWKCDLHNIFHFLRLRMDSHAQKEIRDYADAMFSLIEPIVPYSCEAFKDYRLGAVQLTRLEVESLRSGKPIATTNTRERNEWEAKKAQLQLDDQSGPAYFPGNQDGGA